MKNIEITKKGNILTIKIDTTKEYGLSKSQKTRIIASTGGNKEVTDDGVYLGVNAYRYADSK